MPPLSFGDLDRLIGQLGEQLRRAGLDAGSRIAIALPRGPEAALLSLAVCSVGIVLPINPTLAPNELAEELRLTRPDALIVPGWEPVPAWASEAAQAFGLFQVSAEVAPKFATMIGERKKGGVKISPALDQTGETTFRQRDEAPVNRANPVSD